MSQVHLAVKVLRAFRLIVLPKIYNGACQFQKHDQIRSTATPLRRDVSSLQLPPTLTPKRSQFYFNIWIFFCKREVVVCRLGSQTVAVPVIFHEF